MTTKNKDEWKSWSDFLGVENVKTAKFNQVIGRLNRTPNRKNEDCSDGSCSIKKGDQVNGGKS